MKIYTDKRLEKLTSGYYNNGFHDAVESLVNAIGSGDKVILGNSMSFVGMTSAAPVTMVGNGQIITCSSFTMDKKYKPKTGYGPNNVKICGKL